MASRSLSWMAPIALGAAAMYLLDPISGGRRRALIRDAAVKASRKTRDGAAALACDLQNRVVGAGAEVRGLFDNQPVDEDVLKERVRAQLGRVSSHPGSIDVAVSGDRVVLSGPILSSEHSSVVRAIDRVKGVGEVVDALEPHDTPGSVPGLQGGVVRPGQTWLAGSWSPTSQLAAALAGAGLVAYGIGLRRHSV